MSQRTPSPLEQEIYSREAGPTRRVQKPSRDVGSQHPLGVDAWAGRIGKPTQKAKTKDSETPGIMDERWGDDSDNQKGWGR